MKTLEKLRQDHARRPIEGTAPGEIEKKFPRKEDFYAEPEVCIEKDCNALSFRSQPRCRECHLKWVAEREAESAKLADAYWKRRTSKKYEDDEAKNLVRNLPFCANCGNGVQFSDRIVRLKPKDRRPKKPTARSLLYEMICKGCVGK